LSNEEIINKVLSSEFNTNSELVIKLIEQVDRVVKQETFKEIKAGETYYIEFSEKGVVIEDFASHETILSNVDLTFFIEIAKNYLTDLRGLEFTTSGESI